MAFSLSNWFKGKPTTSAPDSETVPAPPELAASPAPAAAPQQGSVRTVTPNAATPQQPRATINAREAQQRAPISLPTSRLPVSGKVTPVQPPRKVSFPGGSAASESARASAAPAFTPPAPDISISLEVGDFIDRLPPSFVQPGPCDRRKKVEFQAAELYSDLSKGRASVPASVIYAHCPEIFSRPVTQTEDVEVPLPLQKLVEQMGAALSTRTDQVGEENVGEIETPFLQVAMEDNARVQAAAGTAAGPVRPPAGLAAAAPFRPTGAPVEEVVGDNTPIPVPVQHHRTGHISTITPVKASAESPAPPTAATSGPMIPGKRPPSTVRASVAGGKIRLSGPPVVSRIVPVPDAETPGAPPNGSPNPRTHSQRIHLPLQPVPPPASPSHQVAKKTARIQIPPISLRTGGPGATPRQSAVVPPPAGPIPPPPGSTGAAKGPVPSLRPNLGKDAPTVTFRTSPPPPTRSTPSSFAPPRSPAFPPPAFPAVPPAAPAPAAPVPDDGRKIELGLAAILRGLPASMLTVEPSTIPDDVQVTLPFALIESQLSQGRVAIPHETFLQAVPETYRHAFSGDGDMTEVSIPLQEVFQNLPADALSIRNDQVTEEVGTLYPTPFSQKADEDAQRFGVSAAPVLPPAAEVAPSEPEASKDEGVAEVAADAPPVSASPADVELPAEPAAQEPRRDIPLDLAVEKTTEESSAALPTPPEIVAEPIVEARDTAQVTPVPSVAPPAPETLPAPEESAPVEPLALAAQPAAPTIAEPLPKLIVAGLHPAAPEAAAEPVAEVAESTAPTAPKEARVAQIRPLPAQEGVLQGLFMTEEELDAKTIVKLVCQLPSVNGCAVMFEDGLRLAGNFPDGDAEGFSAMAPPFYKKAAKFVSELELGRMLTFTLHTDNGLFSFFMHDNICLSIRHHGRGFVPGVREKLEIITRELARMYSTAKPDKDF